MYRKERKEPAITILDRKDIAEYVRSFIWYMRKSQGRVFDMRNQASVRYMVELMHDPENTAFKSMRDFLGDGRYCWHEQGIEFVPSNLGKGFIFYFRCNGCGHRVKCLYQYALTKSPLCRLCCHLPYPQASRNARQLSKLIRRPYLSSEAKQQIIKRAGITMEDMVAAAL